MDSNVPPFTSPDDDGEWIFDSYLVAAEKFDAAQFLRFRALLMGDPTPPTLALPAQFAQV